MERIAVVLIIGITSLSACRNREAGSSVRAEASAPVVEDRWQSEVSCPLGSTPASYAFKALPTLPFSTIEVPGDASEDPIQTLDLSSDQLPDAEPLTPSPAPRTKTVPVRPIDDAKLLVRMDVCKTDNAVTLLRIERDEIVPIAGKSWNQPDIAVFSDQATRDTFFNEGYVSPRWRTHVVPNSKLKINNLASSFGSQTKDFSLSFPRGNFEFLSAQGVTILKDGKETYYAGYWNQTAAGPKRPKYSDVSLKPACPAEKTDTFMMTAASPPAPLGQTELGMWPAVGNMPETRIKSAIPDGRINFMAFRVCNEGPLAGKISELVTSNGIGTLKYVVNYDRALSTPYSEVQLGGTVVVVPQNLVSVAGLDEARDGDVSKLSVSINVSRTEKWELSKTSVPNVVKFGNLTRGSHQLGDVWLAYEYLVGQLEPGFPDGLEACPTGTFGVDTIRIDEFSTVTVKFCSFIATPGTSAFLAIELSVTDTDPGLPEGLRGKTFTVPKDQMKGIIEGVLPRFTSWPEGFRFLYELHHHSTCNPSSVKFDHASYAWTSTGVNPAQSPDGTCRPPTLIGAPTWTTPFDEAAHRNLLVTEKTIGSMPPKRTYYHCPGSQLSPCNYVPFTP